MCSVLLTNLLHCVSIQKWRYNPLTYELSTFQDPTKCMTYERGYVNCDGSSDQQFRVPSNWLPGISTNVLQSIRLDNTDKCFDYENNLLRLMACNDVASQQFVFDASTHQIKQGDYCLDYHVSEGVFMNADCRQNLLSQVSVHICLVTPSLIFISYELCSWRSGFMIQQAVLWKHFLMTTVWQPRTAAKLSSNHAMAAHLNNSLSPFNGNPLSRAQAYMILSWWEWMEITIVWMHQMLQAQIMKACHGQSTCKVCR